MSEFDDLLARADVAMKAVEDYVLTTTGPKDLAESSPTEIAERLCKLDLVRDRMKLCFSRYTDFLGKIMAADDVIISNETGKAVTKRQGAQRKSWKHEQLQTLVAEAVIAKFTDPETGTLESPLATVIVAALQCPGKGAWKVGELRKLGISPDPYTEFKDGKVTISVGPAYGATAEESTDGDEDDFL